MTPYALRPNADERAVLEAWERVLIPASAIEVQSVIYRPSPPLIGGNRDDRAQDRYQ
jgi:hypothetical protein